MISSVLKESILKSVCIKVIFGAINNVDSIRADIPFIVMIKKKKNLKIEILLWKNFLSKDKMSDSDLLRLDFNTLMTYTMKEEIKYSLSFCGHTQRFQQSSFCDKATTQILLCK